MLFGLSYEKFEQALAINRVRGPVLFVFICLLSELNEPCRRMT